MKRADLFLKSIDTINDVVGKSSAFLFLLLMFIAVIEVTLRYVFNRPTTWAWEINVQLMAAVTVLAAGYVLLHGGHVKMDIVVNMLSQRTRKIIELITLVLFFFVCIVIIYYSVDAAWDSVLSREHTYSIFASPVYPLKCLIPLGAFLLLLQGISRFIRNLIHVVWSRDVDRYEH